MKDNIPRRRPRGTSSSDAAQAKWRSGGDEKWRSAKADEQKRMEARRGWEVVKDSYPNAR